MMMATIAMVKLMLCMILATAVSKIGYVEPVHSNTLIMMNLPLLIMWSGTGGSGSSIVVDFFILQELLWRWL